MPLPDLMILTAANAAQARGYERALASRRKRGLIPETTRTLVVPDCGGRRIGSGASTFLALREAAALLKREGRNAHSLEALFAHRTVWIIHSGGDARRLPAYAPIGKVFVPLPFVAADGGVGSLFELLIADLSKLPVAPSGHVVIAAGDLVVGLDGIASLPDAPVVGVAATLGMDVAQRHGVYVADRRDVVIDFLQKPTRAQAVARGAVTRRGTARVDTGVVVLRPDAAAHWLDAAGVRIGRGPTAKPAASGLLAAIERGDAPSIDLYVHVLSSFAARLDERGYLAACGAAMGPFEATAPHQKDRLLGLRARLRADRQRIVIAPDPLFFHAGTTRELIGHCTRVSPAARRLGFARGVASAASAASAPGRPTTKATLIGSTIADKALTQRGPACLVEGCEILAPLTLDGSNLVAGLRDDVLRRTVAIRLRTGWCLACFPVGPRHWTVVVHGDRDDFKTPIGEGGAWGGVPLVQRIAENSNAWRGVEVDGRRSLFDLALWPVASARRVLGLISWMLDDPSSPTPAWRRAPRRSLRELLMQVDHDRLDQARRSVSSCEASRATATLARDSWASAAAIVAGWNQAAVIERAALDVERGETRRDPFAAARAATVAATAAEATGGSRRAVLHRRRALEIVGRAVAEHVAIPRGMPRAAISSHQVVRSIAPVRIDLAGGWSDTPPICNEVGGAVVNVAITLRGASPVQVSARLLERPHIELRSVDAGADRVMTTAGELHDHRTPGDWTALAKAALVLTGIAPPTASESLARRLGRFGGGVALTMSSNVPQGSGLGTSSILGATILAALGRLRGERLDRAQLVARASALEQMISTRGGWQDQVGGIVGGFKIARSEPGRIQHPRVGRIEVSHAMREELRSRAVLLFTGKRRQARHVLETVVGRWLAREPGVREAVTALRAGAEAMAAALRQARFDEFAARFGEYWRLKCALDPASTTPPIEAMFQAHRRDLAAWGLTGAGGGGFALLIARSAAAAGRVRRSLLRSPPARGAELFEFDVDETGLTVTVGATK